MGGRPGDTIEALHRVATRLQTEDTAEAVCEQTVTAAADVLEFHQCTVVLREGEWLVPYAVSEDTPPDGARRMRVDQGLAGKTYLTDRSHVIEEIEPEDETDPAKEFYRSAISVPIGDRGVFQAIETTTAAFDDDDVELAELLVSHTSTALDRIERERELQQQIDRLDQFASAVSHDLRNPLSVARGHLELAREERDGESLRSVATALERMERLIGDLLAFAKIGTEAMEPEAIELSHLLEECWAGLDRTDATLLVETDRAIRADRDQLRQLLVNLLSNAIDHVDGDVTITVGELAAGFFVEDDGPGIRPDERASVFEAGYSPGPEGTGFGLSIAKQIVEAHGWEIHVTDGNEGGARFEITDVEFAD
ncbi:histidine kinase [Halorubrum sp. 48-1-W]|uniref:GAF domain-containing sensor histidine kinase n=1 Tax=Halorubrum sp. 48-1-W TaxID=2249761 RepID=UPI000DCB787A|nr:GAF domain-containing sensor histidine kinase [Halorubrum sp. 48-1-W]RAW45589.1 histidine kinase [Halorubrum sp. 48-1-W]